MANSYPFSDPVAISRNTANSLGTEFADLRRGLSGLSQPMYGATSGTISGVFPDGVGSAGISNALQGSVSSGLTVQHNAGNYALDRGSGNLYLGMAYSNFTLTLDQGDATNPRIDMVVIRHADPGLTGETTATQSAWPQVLKGTPAASPTKPTNQLTPTDVPLTSYTVGGGSNRNNILAVADERLLIVARGGIYPKADQDTRPGAYEGQYRDNVATNGLERWNGEVWEQVATPASWTQFTPTLYSAAGQVNLGSGGVAFGAYQLMGKTLRVRYLFQAVRPCNMGTGSIYTLLPAGLVAASGVSGIADQHGRCQVNTEDAGYQMWVGDAEVYAGQNKIYPMFPLSASTPVMGNYTVATQSGGVGTGIPLIPSGYPDPTRGLGIYIEMEVQ